VADENNRSINMKRIVLFSVCMLLGLIVLSACGGPSTGPSATPGKPSGNAVLSEGVMTTSVDDDSKPTGGIKTSFPVNTSAVYCSFKVEGVVPEDMVKASLIYVKGAAVGMENAIVYETYMIAESKESSYYLAFFFEKPTSGWNKGDYKIVISVNNKEKLSIPFKIE